MNKLVSKNPVLRFKEGKKIIKAEEGAVARWQRRIKSGINGIGSAFKGAFDMAFNPNNTLFGSLKIYNFTRTVPSRIINSLVVDNYTPENGGTTNNRIRKLRQSLLLQTATSNASNNNSTTTYSLKQQIFPEQVDSNYTHNFLEALRSGYRPNADGTWKAPERNLNNNPSTTNKLVDTSPIIYYDNVVNKFYLEDTNPNSGVSAREVTLPTPMPGYTSTMTKLSNSSPSIPINNIWLKGYKHNEIKDIKAMLKELIKLGLLKDRFGADGKWGKNTEKAYKLYLALKNVPTYEKPEMPSVAAMAGIYSEKNKPLYLQIRFKQGGQLVSGDPVKRFKNKK